MSVALPTPQSVSAVFQAARSAKRALDFGQEQLNQAKRARTALQTYAPVVRKSVRFIRSKMPRRYARRRLRRYRRRPRRRVRSRFSRRNVGFPSMASPCKRHNIANNSGLQLEDRKIDITNTGYFVDLSAIAAGTGINQRERDAVRIRGFKINMFIKNIGRKDPAQSSTEGQALTTFHWAIIVPRNSNTIEVDGANIPLNFFRANGGTRGVKADATLNANQWNTLGINPDNFTILKHKKITLGVKSTEDGWTSGVHKNYVGINTYVPINRQVRYTGGGSDTCYHCVYFVAWCAKPLTTATEALSNCIEYDRHIVTYFRDIN